MLYVFLEPRIGGGVVIVFAEMVIGRIKVCKVFRWTSGMAGGIRRCLVRGCSFILTCSRAESRLKPRILFWLRKLISVLVLVCGSQRSGYRIESRCCCGGVGATGVCGGGSENRVQIVTISYSSVSKVTRLFADSICGAVCSLVHLAFYVVHASQRTTGSAA